MGFLNVVLSPIEIIFDPIIMIGKTVVSIIKLLVDLIKIIPKLFSLFEMFTDPGKVIKDALYAIKVGFEMIFDALFGEAINSIMSLFKNKNINNDEDLKVKANNSYNINISKSYLKYIILVLCPPFAIFASHGIKYFFNILIAFILTYFFYLPGLIYASMYVL